MKNAYIAPNEEQDPLNAIKPGLGLGRDPERTPMQWDGGQYAASVMPSHGYPLLASMNSATLRQCRKNMIRFFRSTVGFSTSNLGATCSSMVAMKHSMQQTRTCFLFARMSGNEQLLIVLNFSNRRRSYDLPPGSHILMSSMQSRSAGISRKNQLKLQPYEAVDSWANALRLRWLC